MLKNVIIVITIFASVITLAYLLGVKAGHAVQEQKVKEKRIEATAAVVSQMGTVNVGDTLSDRILEHLVGGEVRLSEVVSKYTLLSFFDIECNYCLDQMDTIKTSVIDNSDNQNFILVSSDDPADLVILKHVQQVENPVLWDRNMKFANELQILARPFNILIDSNLTVIKFIAGRINSDEVYEICSNNRKLETGRAIAWD